jgi:dsRNA-specific ribonuclease
MVREKDSWLKEAEAKLGQRFRNRALLQDALTHPSVGAEGRAFERLEFLGDAVLGLVLALDLYRRYSYHSPGELRIGVIRIGDPDRGQVLTLHVNPW